MDSDKALKNYVKKRIAILSEEPVDIEKLKALTRSVGIKVPTDPHILEIGIHKMRVNSYGIPKELVEKSAEWLKSNDYSDLVG